MNPELHHKWNAERDPSRGSDKKSEQVLKEQLQQGKVLLKQSKPR
jgi:hypothetical protein